MKANAQDRMVRREVQSRQVLYEAESGIEWAKANLRLNPACSTGTIYFEADQVQIVIVPSGGGYWVTSTVHTSQAERKIKVYLQLDSGKWLETHYQELHQ